MVRVRGKRGGALRRLPRSLASPFAPRLTDSLHLPVHRATPAPDSHRCGPLGHDCRRFDPRRVRHHRVRAGARRRASLVVRGSVLTPALRVRSFLFSVGVVAYVQSASARIYDSGAATPSAPATKKRR